MTTYTLKKDRYSSHMKIVSSLHEMARSAGSRPLRILDVGCSKGFIGKSLSGIHAEVYGIEYDAQDITIAKPWYVQILKADLDGKLPNYQKGFFDVILFADILEHLKFPKRALSHFMPFLKKEGTIILSTANIANIHIRLQLLMGNFDYTEKGILDSTHLKLYTRKSFSHLAHDSGLTVSREDFTPIPLPLIHSIFSEGKPLFPIHQLSHLFAKAIPGVFSYQLIFYCKKK